MSEVHDEWLKRVLGIDVGAMAAAAAADAPGLAEWVSVKDEVDTGLNALVSAMRSTGDADVLQLAEAGLHTHTNGHLTRLMAALTDADRSATPQARRKAAKAAEAFRTFLDGDTIVRLLENNPFGVAVPLRRRMGPVLDRIIAAA